MAQTIVPEKQTVEICLKNKSYYIDFYQREYVWKKETVETLLNDIFYAFELSYEQYKDAELTQELLSKYNWYYLNVFITNNINGKVYIVDGQQRLTTLTLIATKLYHLTSNEDLKDTLKDCIFGKDKWKGNIFRIDHEKRAKLMEMILESTKEEPKEFANTTEETLWNRYNDISTYIDNKKIDEKRLDTFISYFLERLVLVELSVTKDDTPMVFEVINDRGESLKPFEILKGKLIGALDKSDSDEFSRLWENSMQLIKYQEDNFFIDFIRSQYLFKRNSKVETAINNTYHRYIYEANDIAPKFGFRSFDKNQISNIKRFIKEVLPYYCSLYAKITTNSINNEYLSYLSNAHKIAGQYGIIMSACILNDKEELEKVNRISFEYDRMCMLLRLNGVYNSNTLQDLTLSLHKELKGIPIKEYRIVFNRLLCDTFKENRNASSIETLLSYNSFKRCGYGILETRALRYFLARVEKYICDSMGIKMIDTLEDIVTKTSRVNGYHIEHILSRNETNKAYFDTDDDFEQHRNQLGGLLLLKGLDNISSSNEEYVDKLKTYSAGLVWAHTLCEDFYHVNTSLKTFNNKLQNKRGFTIEPINVFNAEALEKRNKLLYEIVKDMWDID